MFDIRYLRLIEPLINLSKLEREAGIGRGLLRKRIKSGKDLRVCEAEAIKDVLKKYGLLIDEKKSD